MLMVFHFQKKTETGTRRDRSSANCQERELELIQWLLACRPSGEETCAQNRNCSVRRIDRSIVKHFASFGIKI